VVNVQVKSLKKKRKWERPTGYILLDGHASVTNREATREFFNANQANYFHVPRQAKQTEQMKQTRMQTNQPAHRPRRLMCCVTFEDFIGISGNQLAISEILRLSCTFILHAYKYLEICTFVHSATICS
jgi:hypothetical protein